MTVLLKSSRLRSFVSNLGQTFASTRRYASTAPMTVKPSPDEITGAKLGPRNLEKAVRALHEDGLVVVSDVIRHDVLDHLNTKMIEDARILQARGKNGPFNYNVGNIQQDPPLTEEYFNPLNLPQPASNANHNINTRPAASSLIHLRKQRGAASYRNKATTPADPHRCRL